MNIKNNCSLLQKIAFCVFVTAIVLLCWKKTYSGHGSLEGLSGPAFSDPSQIMEMPKGWQKQPIKYELSAGGPALVVTLDQQMYFAFSPIIKQFAQEKDLKIVVHKGHISSVPCL
ncbi:MAG: hypothetical protein JSV71_04780 [Nitrospiraceae bacterium]|nr:MAG: hypothetical protein JSV71_04780 [Nitrospiraceae bacterium]